MIKSEVTRILDIVADLSQNDVKKDVLGTEIISHNGLPDVEVRNYLNELEWLNLVKEALPRKPIRRMCNRIHPVIQTDSRLERQGDQIFIVSYILQSIASNYKNLRDIVSP
jgi:hypothetical protein